MLEIFILNISSKPFIKLWDSSYDLQSVWYERIITPNLCHHVKGKDPIFGNIFQVITKSEKNNLLIMKMIMKRSVKDNVGCFVKLDVTIYIWKREGMFPILEEGSAALDQQPYGNKG